MRQSHWTCVAMAVLFLACGEKGDGFEKVTCFDNPHDRAIYTPCRQFKYETKFWDQNYTLISDAKVLLSLTGQTQMSRGIEQIEGIYQYAYDESAVTDINAYNINRTMSDTAWVRSVPQGLGETDTDVWMTPFRQNQFAFTQVSPYPSVNLPLAIGKQWTSNLVMYDGWGDWDNQNLISSYEVIGQGLLETPMGRLARVWQVNAQVETNLGTNSLNFWFHEGYGFVKMIYRNYGGQLLQFELIEVIEMAQ